MNIKNCIRNLFKIGLKTKTIDAQTIEVEYLGKKQDALLYVPYGMQIKTPNEDQLALIYAQEGNEDSLIALLTDIKNRDEIDDDKGLAIGIPDEKERIIFKQAGKIIFKIGDVEGGDFMARFNELKTGFDQLKSDFNTLVTTYSTHTHLVNVTVNNILPGPSTASGTGAAVPTTSPGTPSTASIDAAKIDEIEVPV